MGELSWRSNRMLLDKLKTKEERLWYTKKAIEIFLAYVIIIKNDIIN